MCLMSSPSQVTPNTSVNSYHKTKWILNIKVRRWGTLPIEHAFYIDILYVILTNLFSLPFVVLQNFRNSSSIFFVFDLTSGDSVLANFSTTVIHTATQHKWYSQNIFNCTNSRAKVWRGEFFWLWTIICRQVIIFQRHYYQSFIPQHLKILIFVIQSYGNNSKIYTCVFLSSKQLIICMI